LPETVVDSSTGVVFTKAADAPTTPAAFANTTPAPTTQTPSSTTVDAGPGTTAPVVDPSVPAAPESLLNDKPAVDPAAEPPKTDEPAQAIDPASYKVEGLPDGITIEDPLVKSFLEGAAKGALSNEAVNSVLAEIAPKVAEQLRAPYLAWKTTNDAWQAEVKADPDIGGAKLPQTIATIKKGIERFGGNAEQQAAINKAFNDTGAGNHPAVIKLLHSAFSKLVEGTPVVGSPAEQKITKNAGAALYDHPTSRTTAAA